MIERLLEAERALTVGLLDQAERIYQMAVDADPRNSIAVVGLARVALERGDEARAYAMGLHALEIDGDNQAARRLIDRLVEVRAVRGEGLPRADESPRGSAVAVASPPAAVKPAEPDGSRAEGPKAAAEAAAVAPAVAPHVAPAPSAPAPAPAVAAPVERAATSKPKEAPPSPPPVVPKPAPVAKAATPPPTARAETKAPSAPAASPAAAAPAPRPASPAASAEQPPQAERAPASAAPRKSKVTQPVSIRTAGNRRSSAAGVTPPKTALPKAKPLLPPTPDKTTRAPDRAADADDMRARAPRPQTRGTSQTPTRKLRPVEPKQPGLFDRLFRPKR